MIRIFPIDFGYISIHENKNSYHLNEFLEREQVQNSDSFVPTHACYGTTSSLDLNQRKSYTYSQLLRVSVHPEYLWSKNSVLLEKIGYELETRPSTLIKYEEGGFFNTHRDTEVNFNPATEDDPVHQFNALLFVPVAGKSFEGGDLILHDMETEAESTCVHTIKPSLFIVPTLVVFPILTYHRVTPVISGTRYVFKVPLSNEINAGDLRHNLHSIKGGGEKEGGEKEGGEKEGGVDELCDGGFDMFGDYGGDY